MSSIPNSKSAPEHEHKPVSALNFYQGEQGRRYHGEKRALLPQALPWVTALRAAKLQPYISPNDVVVEYGVGAGWNLAKISCARKIGYDASEFLSDTLARLGIEFCSKFESLGPASADVVICHHTLEHVNVPAETLAQIRNVLKPGGKLLLYVPWDRENKYRDYNPADLNHHLYTWNAQCLGNLLRVNGYRIEKISVRRYGYDRFCANLCRRFGLGELAFRSLRRMLLIISGLYEVQAVAFSESDSRPA